MTQCLAAVVVLCAAWLMPSLASAHEGHANLGHAHPGHAHPGHAHPGQSHHASAIDTTTAPAAEPADATSSVALRRIDIVRAASIAAAEGVAIGDGGCAGHCCGAAAGMTCCGAALAPEITIAPTLRESSVLLFERTSALLGLPAEALPKPPRSFT